MVERNLVREQFISQLRTRMSPPVGGFSDVSAPNSFESSSPHEAVFNQALSKMIAALGNQVKITSGKRTRAQQEKLYREKPHLAAKPGTSNHEFGLAADLKFASPAVRAQAHKIAAQFGLVFPMAHEPWHVELIDAKKRRASKPQVNVAPMLGGNAALMEILKGNGKQPGENASLNPHAKNPKSSAFGIGQLIKSNRIKYGKQFGFHPDTTDPREQLTMMLAYIKDRYGTVENALAFRRRKGWY